MKELTIEQKAKAYDEAIKKAKGVIEQNPLMEYLKKGIEYIFPELKESEDEKIRKELLQIAKESEDSFYMVMTPNKREKLIAWLEKQGEQNLTDVRTIGYWHVEDVEQKPADKVEPKFKVKYAGCEYNVLEVKDIAGVTYYGIEDEPNHIDYVKADNCKIISGGYGIKENGSPYPTKTAVFSEQKPAWSEEDENMLEDTCRILSNSKECTTSNVRWLKSLRPQSQWKPSKEQLYYLYWIANIKMGDSVVEQDVSKHLNELYEQLKQL